MVDRRHLLVVDASVPMLVGTVIVAGEYVHGSSSTSPAAVGVGLAAAAVLCARRRAPGVALVVSGGLVAVLLHIDRSAGAVGLIAPAVALYSLALRRGRREQLLAGLAAGGAVIAADTLHSGGPTVFQTLGHVLLVAIPLLAAEAIRTHRSYLLVLEERLELAERTQEQQAERRAEQERMRIARELHDVVAHTLTEINVQAAGAAERLQPGEARAALERIEDASHNAIGELRTVLGALRDSEPFAPPRGPTPGIENIAELAERARDAGLDIQLAIQGNHPRRLSQVSSLAAYRIVQESLTNARRHAPGAPVRVNVSFDPDRLSIAIKNPNRSPTQSGSPPGVGIRGMVERAAVIGGTLHAGPTTDGFSVHAELPYEPAS